MYLHDVIVLPICISKLSVPVDSSIAKTQELLHVSHSVRYPFTGKVTGFTKTLSNSYGEGDSKEEG